MEMTMKTLNLALRYGVLSAAAAALGSILLIGFAFAQAPAPAQVAGQFAGNWIEDQSMRKIGALRNLTFREGSNGLEELRGSYARPLVQPVRFGDTPYSVDSGNNTLVWKQLGQGRFERTIGQNGKTISIRRIQITSDGKTLTEVTETNLADGKKANTTIVYKRTTGDGQGLAGSLAVDSSPAPVETTMISRTGVTLVV
jgi:hypothetical protein